VLSFIEILPASKDISRHAK